MRMSAARAARSGAMIGLSLAMLACAAVRPGGSVHPRPSSPTIADPYAGWRVYSDGDISFKYPRSWIVRDDRATGGRWVTINASDDSGIEITQASPRRWLEASIGPWELSNSADSTCREPCKIYDTIRLSIASSTSRLVISGWGAQGAPPEVLEVLDDPGAVVGASTYKLGTTVHGRSVRVQADVAYVA